MRGFTVQVLDVSELDESGIDMSDLGPETTMYETYSYMYQS